MSGSSSELLISGGFSASIEVDPAGQSPPFDWADLFGNDHPIEVEIGCGKGKFLGEAARRNPEVNYLGVERAGKYYRKAVARLSRTGLSNLRLLRADGLDLLDRWVPPGSIRRLHVYFPDPWPKKRHHKRRIFSAPFLALAARALPPGGELRVATDHAEYGRIIRDLLAAHAREFEPLDWPVDGPDRLPTHYSIKWERAGRPLWWGRYRRRACTPGKAQRS